MDFSKSQNEENTDASMKARVQKTPLTSRQVVILIAVSGADLVNGMMFGWTAVLPKLQEDTSRFTVTEDDVSWLGEFLMVVMLMRHLFKNIDALQIENII
ncbi:uncharacterized protein LOC134765907 [Penaeus indicus]|uniref:uncharacterized protein LOC134765907 n=1 Tax=Penaeus indicus TaxID=29960 RepID=UPI00300D1950